jgi:hypothetical protein
MGQVFMAAVPIIQVFDIVLNGDLAPYSFSSLSSRLIDILYITDEIISWRKLHSKEIHNLYSSQNIIRMTNSRSMRWKGHVARMVRRGLQVGFW